MYNYFWGLRSHEILLLVVCYPVGLILGAMFTARLHEKRAESPRTHTGNGRLFGLSAHPRRRSSLWMAPPNGSTTLIAILIGLRRFQGALCWTARPARTQEAHTAKRDSMTTSRSSLSPLPILPSLAAFSLFAVLVAASSGCSDEPSPDSAIAPTSATVFLEQTVTDPGMNHMAISTILVPEGWQLEGGAIRSNPGLFNMPVLIDVSITAPDGRGIHFLPSLAFEFDVNQDQYGGGAPQKMQPLQSGSLYYPLPESPGEWIIDLASINPADDITRLKLVSEEDIPEITAALRKQNASRYQMTEQMNQTTASMGFGSEFDTQATQVVLEYDKGGRTIEETIVMTWLYDVGISQGRITRGSWNIISMQSLSGPKGTNYVEDPVLNAIFQSVRVNPSWTAEMNKYWVELANIKHKGNMAAIKSAAKISQIQADSANEVSDIISKGWSERSASSDRIQAKTIDAIGEQTVYRTPTGDAVKLPSFYDKVYTDGDGRYLLHNDELYDPNRDPDLNDQNWEQVEAVR